MGVGTAVSEGRAVTAASPCPHPDFQALVEVNRIEDVGRFQADVQIRCALCWTPFRFLGLRTGVDLAGARCSVDGATAHLAIAPKGEAPEPLPPGSVRGFDVEGRGS